MPKKTIDTRPEIIYCKCGCGEVVPKKKYPSQQNYYIRHHQHRGKHNGNYRGGKSKQICPVCMNEFYAYPAQKRVTCGGDECYRKWQGLTTVARGSIRVEVNCAHCGKAILKWPSQVKEKNYCNRYCLAADNPKVAHLNGNWQGGKWRFIKEQAMIRDGYKCVICGFNYHVHVHHITPLSEGGTNEFSNLITLCPNHHTMVHGGIISVEHLRNFDWTPEVTTDPTPHANR